MHTKTLTARFVSDDDFIDDQIGGRLANAVSKLSEEKRVALVTTLHKAFEPYVDRNGFAFPMESHVVLARKQPGNGVRLFESWCLLTVFR